MNVAIDTRFRWTTFDVRTLLPEGWQDAVLEVAKTDARFKVLRARSVTSRERDREAEIPTLTVNGEKVREALPWLYHLYKGAFRNLAQQTTTEEVSCAANDLYGCVLNVQRGQGMRYECHVDSNPVEGLLYVTDHPPGSGGELVVANTTQAANIEEVDEDPSIVYPKAGHLIFFDARGHAHYVRALQLADDFRVVVAMNFYTPSCPESARPADLTAHLLGEL